MRTYLIGAAVAVMLVVGAWWAWSAVADAKDEARRAQNNAAALKDTNRDLTNSLTELDGRRAAERLALEQKIEVLDAAVLERGRQLKARTVALTRVSVQRDSLSVRLQNVNAEPDRPFDLFTADTAGITAAVTITPALVEDNTVDLRLSFTPAEVLTAFMRDEDGRLSVLALTDSLHRAVILEPPEFEPPPRRTPRISVSLPVGLALVVGAYLAGLLTPIP